MGSGIESRGEMELVELPERYGTEQSVEWLDETVEIDVRLPLCLLRQMVDMGDECTSRTSGCFSSCLLHKRGVRMSTRAPRELAIRLR